MDKVGENARRAADMDALVVCRAGRLRSAGMVVLFGCQRVGVPVGGGGPARLCLAGAWPGDGFVIGCWVEMPV
jgi:hypothetical protein